MMTRAELGDKLKDSGHITVPISAVVVIISALLQVYEHREDQRIHVDQEVRYVLQTDFDEHLQSTRSDTDRLTTIETKINTVIRLICTTGNINRTMAIASGACER